MVRYSTCALLLLSGVYSFIRGFNPPLSYPLCQWFSTYEFGFVKRGLVGTLIAPLFHFRTGAEIREMVELAAMGIMVLKFLCVGWLARTVVGYARTLGVRSRIPVVATLMVFLLSPHMVFSAHLAGYFDHLLEIITITALVAIAKEKYFLLPFLCIAALCVHEMFAIYGLPVIGFAMIVKLFDRSKKPVRFPVALLTAIFAPVLFLGIFLHFAQQVYSTHQLEQMRDRANQYGAVSSPGIQNMVNHLGEGVLDSWRMQRKSGPRSRLTDAAVVKGTYPATALFAIIACILLLQKRRWFSAALLPVVAVLPLAANYIAWDGYRFASNALFQSFLALFAVVYLTRPKLQLPTVGTVLWLIPLIAAGINHIWQPVPLMDHQIDGSGVFSYRTSPDPRLFDRCKPLFANSTFDTGGFSGWEAKGEAFMRKHKVLRESRYNHTALGRYWLLSFSRFRDSKGKVLGDRTTGRLISREFVIRNNAIIFRVAGGRDRRHLYASLRVEGKEIYRTTGHNGNDLTTHFWNVEPFIGKQARIEIVDQSTSLWGHIDVDQFCWSN